MEGIESPEEGMKEEGMGIEGLDVIREKAGRKGTFNESVR